MRRPVLNVTQIRQGLDMYKEVFVEDIPYVLWAFLMEAVVALKK